MSTQTAAPPVVAPVEWAPRRRRRAPMRAAQLRAARLLRGLVLTPVYVLLVTSFKPLLETDASHAWALPHDWTLDALATRPGRAELLAERSATASSWRSRRRSSPASSAR